MKRTSILNDRQTKGDQGMNEMEQIKLINTKQLQLLLGCCYRQARKIGEEAQAKVMIGSAPRWKVSRINQYLEQKCEEAVK